MRAVDSRRHKTSHSGRLLDDGRRLLYMSCTGMKRLLFITYSQRRTDSQLHTGRDAGSPREHSWGAERVTGSVSAQVAGDQADGGEVVLDHAVAAGDGVDERVDARVEHPAELRLAGGARAGQGQLLDHGVAHEARGPGEVAARPEVVDALDLGAVARDRRDVVVRLRRAVEVH